MKRFQYHGPKSGVTLRERDDAGEVTEREVQLDDGAIVELPETHPHIKTLAALGHLTELPLLMLPAPGQTTEAQ